MKKIILIFLLVVGCLSEIVSQRVYTNILYCNSTLMLYDTGRADWYDCEVNETFYGHYWFLKDTLFIETFCSSECHEDHKCIVPRVDVYISKQDTLINVGYIESNDKEPISLDSICYFQLPYVYIEGEGFTSSCGQSRKCVTEEEYFSLTEIYAEAITTNESPELTKFHGELGDEDKNLNILLMEKQKNVFVVMLKQNEYTKSGATIELYNMTLPNDISLFVYSAMYDSPLILYNSPSTRSMKEQCDTYVADPLLIIDVYNTWLKVQFEESGKKFEGWIPKEEYCANPYTTCN